MLFKYSLLADAIVTFVSTAADVLYMLEYHSDNTSSALSTCIAQDLDRKQEGSRLGKHSQDPL